MQLMYILLNMKVINFSIININWFLQFKTQVFSQYHTFLLISSVIEQRQRKIEQMLSWRVKAPLSSGNCKIAMQHALFICQIPWKTCVNMVKKYLLKGKASNKRAHTKCRPGNTTGVPVMTCLSYMVPKFCQVICQKHNAAF